MRFVILMTDGRRVKCCTIIIHLILSGGTIIHTFSKQLFLAANSSASHSLMALNKCFHLLTPKTCRQAQRRNQMENRDVNLIDLSQYAEVITLLTDVASQRPWNDIWSFLYVDVK